MEYPSDLSQRKTGLIAALSILRILASATPFSIFYALGMGVIGDTGLMMATMTAFYSALPFKPLAGQPIFKYHKGLWGAIFLAGLFLFLSVIFDLLPHIAYLFFGFTAMCILAGLIDKLKREAVRDALA